MINWKKAGIWAFIAFLYFPTGTPDDVIALGIMASLGPIYWLIGAFILVMAAQAVRGR